MAEKRMFAKSIVESDAFLDMTLSAQALYFHLSMAADDEGFVNNPKMITRIIGCHDGNFDELVNKKFVIRFDSGVAVIKHWNINNYIRKDRIHPTNYESERASLNINKNGSYTLRQADVSQLSANCPSNVRQMSGKCQASLEQSRLEQNRLDEGQDCNYNQDFNIPTLNEIKAYVKKEKIPVEPVRFFNYCEARGWHIGGKPIRNWKAYMKSWVKEDEHRPDRSYDTGAYKDKAKTVPVYEK